MIKFDSSKNVLEIAMTIETKEEAENYLEDYAYHIWAQGKGIKNTEAMQIAKDNIGYFAGYYSREVRERVEKLFNAPHPILGSVHLNLSSQEVFELGKAWAERNTKEK